MPQDEVLVFESAVSIFVPELQGVAGEAQPHQAHVSVADNPVIVPDRELEGEKKPGESEPPRIRCPLCGWSPRKEDKWFCECGHSWNTFDTGGVCPACLHQWTETQCLSCARWSPHSDWYSPS